MLNSKSNMISVLGFMGALRADPGDYRNILGRMFEEHLKLVHPSNAASQPAK
jgi:hypothetical protein